MSDPAAAKRWRAAFAGMPGLLVYALFLFACGWIKDARPQPGLLMAAPEFLQFTISNDPHTFVGAAMEVYQHGWLTPQSQWIFHLWPPGFVLLEAAIFKVLGQNAPFLAVLFALSIAFGVAMMALMRKYLKHHLSPFWAFVIPLVPFLFPVTRFFLLQPIGLAFGEGFSIIFFIAAVFLILLASSGHSFRKAMLAGVALALSAYFRSQYEFLVMVMTVGAVLLAAWFVFAARKESKRNWKASFMSSSALVVLTAMLTAQALMLPWRIHNFLDAGKWNWVQTQDLIARNSLASEKKLLELGGKFVIAGGGHLACRFEPEYCDTENNASFYKAFLKNMPSWYAYKMSIIGNFWFPKLSYLTVIAAPTIPRDYVGNSLILAFMLASFILLAKIRGHRSFPVHAWLLCSFYACFFVVFSLVQFEVRYFFLIKIFAVFSALALGAEAWAGRAGARRPLSAGDVSPETTLPLKEQQ